MSGFLTGIGCLMVATTGGVLLGFAMYLIGLYPKPINAGGAFFAGYVTCLLIGHYVYRLRPQKDETP